MWQPLTGIPATELLGQSLTGLISMQPKELLQSLLELGNSWDVVKADYDNALKTLQVQIKENEDLWINENCPRCHGNQVTLFDHIDPRTWRHENAFGKKVMILCPLPRGKCNKCGYIYRVKASWEGKCKYFTKPFEVFVLSLMKYLPVREVSRVAGEKDHRLWRLLFSYVEGARTELSKAAVRILKRTGKISRR